MQIVECAMTQAPEAEPIARTILPRHQGRVVGPAGHRCQHESDSPGYANGSPGQPAPAQVLQQHQGPAGTERWREVLEDQDVRSFRRCQIGGPPLQEHDSVGQPIVSGQLSRHLDDGVGLDSVDAGSAAGRQQGERPDPGTHVEDYPIR